MQRIAPSPSTSALTVVAYVVSTFAVQGASHFAINADLGLAQRRQPAAPVAQPA